MCTEASDFLGGLRPARRRRGGSDDVSKDFVSKVCVSTMSWECATGVTNSEVKSHTVNPNTC